MSLGLFVFQIIDDFFLELTQIWGSVVLVCYFDYKKQYVSWTILVIFESFAFYDCDDVPVYHPGVPFLLNFYKKKIKYYINVEVFAIIIMPYTT